MIMLSSRVSQKADLSYLADIDITDIESLERAEFIHSADPSYVVDLYPSLFENYGSSLASQIACLSSVVGMQVPGLHSIFVSASLNLKKSTNIQFIDVIKTDRRFSLVDLKVNTANVDAKLRAIARPAPVGSLPLSALQRKINKKLYDGKKILVIGGSRGIGAYAVKILALMGANITFSYAKGLQDSIELKELKDAEISINFVHFDVTKPCFDKLLECDPDYVFYFATPKIFVKEAKILKMNSMLDLSYIMWMRLKLY